MKDRCGFLFIHYKRHCCTELVSWEHAACLLSGIKKRPLVGGWLNTSSVVIQLVPQPVSIIELEVVRLWEGPLWEIPLYLVLGVTYIAMMLQDWMRKFAPLSPPDPNYLFSVYCEQRWKVLQWTTQVQSRSLEEGVRKYTPFCSPSFWIWTKSLLG